MRYGQIQWFTVNGALFIPGIIARQNRQRRTHFQYDVASIIRLQKCDIYFPENVLQIAKIMSIHRFSRNEKKNFIWSTLTVQSATSSLNGFHVVGVLPPIDVDNCCKITVSRSDRDRFISDFGLSFSVPPVTFVLCSGYFALRNIDDSTIWSKSWSWLLPSHKLFSAGSNNFVSEFVDFSNLFRIYRINTPHASVICSIWFWHTASTSEREKEKRTSESQWLSEILNCVWANFDGCRWHRFGITVYMAGLRYSTRLYFDDIRRKNCNENGTSKRQMTRGKMANLRYLRELHWPLILLAANAANDM